MNDFIPKLCVVIVLYKIPLEASVSFQSIRSASRGNQELSIFVYDNSPEPQTIDETAGLHILYCHNPKNPGVSAAYNAGATYAREAKKEWIFLLDQDTTLPKDILNVYGHAVIRKAQIRLFAPILELENGKLFSPCRYLFKRGFHLKEVVPGLHKLGKLAPVNSGMLIRTDAFFRVGGYNEAVKLDFSDFQFIERFRKVYPIFYLVDVVCQQDFSDAEVSFSNQFRRFKFYCEGALYITKDGILDWIQYHFVVFCRALRLTIRHKKVDFLSFYVNYFLVNSVSSK